MDKDTKTTDQPIKTDLEIYDESIRRSKVAAPLLPPKSIPYLTHQDAWITRRSLSAVFGSWLALALALIATPRHYFNNSYALAIADFCVQYWPAARMHHTHILERNPEYAVKHVTSLGLFFSFCIGCSLLVLVAMIHDRKYLDWAGHRNFLATKMWGRTWIILGLIFFTWFGLVDMPIPSRRFLAEGNLFFYLLGLFCATMSILAALLLPLSVLFSNAERE